MAALRPRAPRSPGALMPSLRRPLFTLVVLLTAGLPSLAQAPAPARPAVPVARASDDRPNIIVFLTDDLGYGDVGAFGGTAVATPQIDRLAAEGVTATHFYAQPVCSASRASLLTGAYPVRVGIGGALMPDSPIGLATTEATLPRVLRQRGYATALVGKWHLGDRPAFMPPRQGFDEYYGLPYSNDMWPPNTGGGRFSFPQLRLLDGDTVVTHVTADDQKLLTRTFTDKAVSFIERHRAQPFFLYLAHPMPHVPLFVSDRFASLAARSLYAATLSELDWSMGRILEALETLRIADRTIVIFMSDNGPWIQYGDHGGSPGPLRAGKHTTFEGGIRVPFLARWPGRVPARTTVETPLMSVDLLPTLARAAGAAFTPAGPIDGVDILPWLTARAPSADPHDAIYYYGGFTGTELHAVRSGRWKLHVTHPYVDVVPGSGGAAGTYVPKTLDLSLFDLVADPGETTNVAASHADVVARLQALIERARADLGDSLTKRAGAGVRAPGRTP